MGVNQGYLGLGPQPLSGSRLGGPAAQALWPRLADKTTSGQWWDDSDGGGGVRSEPGVAGGAGVFKSIELSLLSRLVLVCFFSFFGRRNVAAIEAIFCELPDWSFPRQRCDCSSSSSRHCSIQELHISQQAAGENSQQPPGQVDAAGRPAGKQNVSCTRREPACCSRVEEEDKRRRRRRWRR